MLPLGRFAFISSGRTEKPASSGVNGKRKSTPRELVRASCSVSRVFNATKIGNYFAPSSAIFGTQSSAHFASSPRRGVKTDWPYSEDRASSARTSSVSCQNWPVPFTDRTVQPASSDKWKAALVWVSIHKHPLMLIARRNVTNAVAMCKSLFYSDLTRVSVSTQVPKKLTRVISLKCLSKTESCNSPWNVS